MYYFPQPPYFLLVAGLFVALTSGVAFRSTLVQGIQAWVKDSSISLLQDTPLFFPFLGMSFGVWLFLASGLEVFGIPAVLSYPFALVLTVFTAGLVWWQLGKLLIKLQQGGSKALDLDSLF